MHDDNHKQSLIDEAEALLSRGLGLAPFMMRNASDAEDVLQDVFITALAKVEDAHERAHQCISRFPFPPSFRRLKGGEISDGS